MEEKEKEAIKYFYNIRATIDESNMLFDEDINIKCGKEMIKQITVILNLIQKQQAELEKKDRIIDEMLQEFTDCEFELKCSDCCIECEKDYDQLYECNKQYFERRVNSNE